MKTFAEFIIIADTLEVCCNDTETGDSYVEVGMDLKPFYFYPDLGLEDNIFLDCLPWDDHEMTDEESKAKEAYMGSLSSRVANAVKEYLDREGILIWPNFYDESVEEEKNVFILDYSFVMAVANVFGLDENWRRKDECRFSEEDAALLRSAGIDPCGNVPDEVLQLVKMGCPVLNEEPDFIKKELQ